MKIKHRCYTRIIAAVLPALFPLLLSFDALAADCQPNSRANDTRQTSGAPQDILARLKCLDERIAALEGSGPAWKAAAERAKTALHSQEAGHVRIEMDSCSMSNGNMACDLYITASEDKDVEFREDSRAVDENGSTFYWLGYQTPGQKMDTGIVRRYFVGETRTRATAIFRVGDLVPAGKLSAVQLQFSTAQDGAKERYALTIRNVPLKEEPRANRMEAAAAAKPGQPGRAVASFATPWYRVRLSPTHSNDH